MAAEVALPALNILIKLATDDNADYSTLGFPGGGVAADLALGRSTDQAAGYLRTTRPVTYGLGTVSALAPSAVTV